MTNSEMESKQNAPAEIRAEVPWDQKWRKPHLHKLPNFELPTQFRRDSKSVAISIPIFDAEFNYDPYEFKGLIRGAAWAALSIASNTDLCENGVPIYFHVEDSVMNTVKPILKKFGLQEWIRETSFKKTPLKLKEPRLTKKNYAYEDPGLDQDALILWDADAFVCRPIETPKLKWYHHWKNGCLRDAIGTIFFFECNQHTIEYTNWVRSTIGLEKLDDSPEKYYSYTKEELCRGLKEAYDLFELEPRPLNTDNAHTYGAAVTSVPRKSGCFEFQKNKSDFGVDDALLSLYMNSHPTEKYVKLDKILAPFVMNPTQYMEEQNACILHLWTDNHTPIELYQARIIQEIQGFNRH